MKLKADGNSGSSTHFFVEIIIVLLFMSIVAAVIMYIYSVTDRKNSMGQYEAGAARNSALFINEYKASHDYVRALEKAFGKGEYNPKNGVVHLRLDAGFEPCDSGRLEVDIEIRQDDGVETIDMVYCQNVFDDDREFYTINAAALKE